MVKKIKITVLGYGHIGKKHVEMILQNPEFELVAIIDIDKEQLTTCKDLQLSCFESFSLFSDANITTDIIAICTPNGLHFQQAKEILENKIHVIIEKPIALKHTDAESLTEIAQRNNLKIFPVMQNRFSPPALWLKELLKSKKLGKIFMVQISCYWNRDERYYSKNSWRGTKDLDGGTLYTQFSHYLDILYWLFGDITNLKTKLEDFNHQDITQFEDSGIVTFDFVSGGIGSFNFSTSVWQENLESSITIIAENGSVKVGGQYMDQVQKCLIKDYEMPVLALTSASNDYGTYKGSAQNHHFLYQNVAEVFQNGGKAQTEAQESVELIKIIEEIYSKE